MKVVYQKELTEKKRTVAQSEKRNNKSREQSIKIESFLFLFVSFCVLFMVGVQGFLLNPQFNAAVGMENKAEGVMLTNEETLFKKGFLVLKLTGVEANGNVMIYVNGDPKMPFDQSEILLEVKEGDVIEIDGTMIQTKAIVEVISGSPDIEKKCLQKKISLQANFVRIMKVKMNA